MCTNARWHWLQCPQFMCRPVVRSWSTHVQPCPEAEQSPTDISNIPPYPLWKICSASFLLRWNFPFISQTPLQRAIPQPTPHLQSPQYISRPLCFTHCQFILGSMHFQASCSACQFWRMLSLWWILWFSEPSAKVSLLCWLLLWSSATITTSCAFKVFLPTLPAINPAEAPSIKVRTDQYQLLYHIHFLYRCQQNLVNTWKSPDHVVDF